MNAIERAQQLDAADELASFRSEFSFPKTARGDDVVYLTGNSLGLMPLRARDVINGELDAWGRLGVEGHFAPVGASFSSPKTAGPHNGPAEPWFSYHRLFRERGAAILDALDLEPDGIQRARDLLHGSIRVEVFAQPGKRELHRSALRVPDGGAPPLRTTPPKAERPLETIIWRPALAGGAEAPLTRPHAAWRGPAGCSHNGAASAHPPRRRGADQGCRA